MTCNPVKLHFPSHRLCVFYITKLPDDKQITRLDFLTAALPTFLHTFETNLIM